MTDFTPPAFEETVLQRRLRERREAERKTREAEAAVLDDSTQWDSSLIPDTGYTRTDADQQLDDALDRVGIIEAYTKWCGKMTPTVHNGQTESIMISCPMPHHKDSNPSAWVNTKNNTWFCGTCQEGGDKYDIAAFHFGYPVPAYKTDRRFKDLRVDMAQSLGYAYVEAPGVPKTLVAPDSGPADTPEPEPQIILPAYTPLSVTEPDLEWDIPALNWRAVVPTETFLWEYMTSTTIDDVAEEFHFWNAMIALGFALGRECYLEDAKNVFSNLFVCTLGRTGSGKSKAKAHLDTVLQGALPWDHFSSSSNGVKNIGSPASAEALIHSFVKPIMDDTDPKGKKVSGYVPVKGLVNFNELSSLTGRAGRLGNVLKPTLMQFYDMDSRVSTVSITNGLSEAVDPFASVSTTTQPRALRNLVSTEDLESGFLNRWIFAPGPDKKKVAMGGQQPDLTEPIRLLQNVNGWVGFGRTIAMSPDALKDFSDYFENVLLPIQQRDDSKILTRLDLTAKKMMLLLSANKHDLVVTDQTVAEMKRIMAYLVASYAIPANSVGSGLLHQIRGEVLKHITRLQGETKRGVTIRELNQRMKRQNFPPDAIIKTIDFMVKLEDIKAEVANKGHVGRPTVRYSLVED